jgi:alkanesulfonate monooxygenase SsuD/methylene tetrahydromethanopterin reductase-like flavin-dependent oxidoreductase (luciferase family)
LPSPFVFLGHLAARTQRIRLGTGIITLPLELPVRVAEDAIVLDLISNNRLELGVGNGGNSTACAGFGLDNEHRNDLFVRNLARLRGALKGEPIPGGDTLYPQKPDLAERIWQASLSVAGGARAGLAGDG